ncbi:MAG: hypothetical protein R2795_03825 [Saprospiraceae bacterium]
MAKVAPIILLDTGLKYLNEGQLQFLAKTLAAHAAPICLFMHHPPIPMGVPFMDEHHALQATDALLAILAAHSYPITIFTGHYHVDKSARWKHVDVHVTPSCFFQIDWRSQAFQVDHYRKAYRVIDWDGERLLHGLVYF